MKFLLNIIENSMNRELHMTQLFSKIKQKNKQTIKIFDAHLNILKNQFFRYIEKQKIIHFFIKLRSFIKIIINNYQNIFQIRETLMILTNKLKNNFKKKNDVITTSKHERFKEFKSSFSKFHKNKRNDEIKNSDIFKQKKKKNKNHKKKHENNKFSIEEIICYNCNEKNHYANKCSNPKINDKNAKLKINAIDKSGKNKPSRKTRNSTKEKN